MKIRNLTIGSGRPKVCVSLTATTGEKLIEEAGIVLENGADLIEWRIDYFQHFEDEVAVREVLRSLRTMLGDCPLLFTFRTQEEGGNAGIDSQTYEALNRWAIESHEADLIDLELFRGEDLAKNLITAAHNKGKWVVLSNHDFNQTPEKGEIISRLTHMKDLGADLVKIALMPNCKQDVLTLMEASITFNETYPTQAMVTMAMGEMGLITRIAGQFTGSAMTFGAGITPSAPGQLPGKEVLEILERIQRDE